MTGILARWKPRGFLFTRLPYPPSSQTQSLLGSLRGNTNEWFVWESEEPPLPVTTALGLNVVALDCHCTNYMCSIDLLNSFLLKAEHMRV